MSTIFYIEGKHIHDIPSFYEEINRVFMQHEDWKLGANLDALDDMLYGGYGALQHEKAPFRIEWNDAPYAKESLGVEATKAYYRHKLQYRKIFNADIQSQRLKELENGNGKTYFEIVLEIFAAHPQIDLILKG